MPTDGLTEREIPGLYRITSLRIFRHTPGVTFDNVPLAEIPRIDAVDRVIHEREAISPGPVEGVERPWYMHTHQDDNLVVLHGTRHVEIYTSRHGSIERFEVRPDCVLQEGKVVFDGPAMLVWPRGVFHRIRSSSEGSAAINFAVHYPGIDAKTNFNIYSLDTTTGSFSVIRQGNLDQKVGGTAV